MLNVDKYAKLVANKKGISDVDTIQKMRDVLNDVLKMRYYAVCIDIDGVLINKNLDITSSIDIIASLLNKKVPVVLTTGRGESSTRQFISDLTQILSKYKKANSSLFKYISCICNNGSILMYSSNESEKLLDRVRLLASKSNIEKLNLIAPNLIEKISHKFNDKVSFVSSYSDSLECVTSIRFRIKDESCAADLVKELADITSSRKTIDGDIYKVSMGHYSGDLVYQIGVTDSSESANMAEYILGIPQNCMIRICDEGKKYGNDYEILDVSQAFSTGSISSNPFTCFPVIDDNERILTGTEATQYLVNNLDICPCICLEKADFSRQQHLLAIAEKNIIIGGSKFKEEEDRIYRQNFGTSRGIYDVYDVNTGGVKFYDYEWELIPNTNPYKDLFSVKNFDGKLENIIESEDSVILRGANTYYYFLANCKLDKEIKSNELEEWKNNYCELLKEFRFALGQDCDKNDINKRFKLAILDNMRNISLIMLNSTMVEEFNGTNIHILFDTYKKKPRINNWACICEEIFGTMGKLSNSKFCDQDINGTILETLDKVIPSFERDLDNLIHKNNPELNGKCIRNYREIDCYGENRLALDFAIRKIKEEQPSISEKDVSFNGMAYGGLELPFIAKELLAGQENIALGGILHSGNYGERHSKSIKDLESENFTILGEKRTLNGYNVVMDDNVLTGKTLQIALNGLFNNRIHINDIIAVRYPPMSRVTHMFKNNHGAIDTTQFFTYIKGLIIPSPYSKLGYFATKEESYKDEFNVFDIRKRKIYEYIYKTGNFKLNSRVGKEFEKGVII